MARCPTLKLTPGVSLSLQALVHPMTITIRDKIAVLVSVLLGLGFAYLAMVTGGLLVAGFYAIFVIPLVVIFLADERKILIWQACVLSFAIAGAVLAKTGGAFFPFWTIGSAVSSPAAVYYFWRRTKFQAKHEPVWVLAGIVLVAVESIFWLDPFVTVGFLLLWLVACASVFGWQCRVSPKSAGARVGMFTALGCLLATIATLVMVGVFHKQQIFRSAINHHHPRTALMLVRMGADPSKPDARGITALAEAAWDNTGDLEGTKELLAMGANVNGQQAGEFNGLLASGTALDAAASADRGQICQVLIDAGADVNMKNQAGKTPLLVALSHSGIHCVPALLNHGADPTVKDQQGHTALMYLTNYDADDPVIQSIARFLVNHGIDVEDWAREQKRDKWASELHALSESRRR
jgi:hypothetical protein